MAPINQLGYGIAGLNILKALQKQCTVSLFPIGQPQVTTEEDHNHVKFAIEKARFFDAKAPCIKIWHQNDMSQFVGKGEHIGFPIFELDVFDELEQHHLNSCDRLFVCSEWAKQTVKNNLSAFSRTKRQIGDGKPIDVIPLGVDTNIFKPTPYIDGGKTFFFNCGKWEIRKGHDFLIKAFKIVAEEFENVELWMMCSNPFNSQEENLRWQQLYNHPKVKLIPRAETQAEVYNVMSQVSCGVFPSRAEGWNLELLEMMACGKSVITTGYAAHTEFCTKENSNIIPIDSTESAFDGKWFFNQGNWAKIGEKEISSLVDLMKNVIKSGNKTNISGIETAQRFSWDNSAAKILKSLDQ
jgi:glycosyltransferase involved in cell wall biosynthesis